MLYDLREVDAEIAELENTNLKRQGVYDLAALYAIRNQITGNAPGETSSSQVRNVPERLGEYGDSVFLQSVAGKNAQEVFSVMNELMDTLRVVNVKVYTSVLRKIQNI